MVEEGSAPAIEVIKGEVIGNGENEDKRRARPRAWDRGVRRALRNKWRTPLRSLNLGLEPSSFSEKMDSGSRGCSEESPPDRITAEGAAMVEVPEERVTTEALRVPTMFFGGLGFFAECWGEDWGSLKLLGFWPSRFFEEKGDFE
ncbi:uncharacterized protein DS421_19g665220 [Arachis hypogaea]|uniref:Uncharacterized protein n=1 Tax=Arachis hypogaea TaxID=3818 RepID=A0A6B9VBE2_ARAHY|nr:uncharacterized protein DS421_19g665220 [Arachis hypogaea]